jgi:hypothetical protein
LLERQRDILKDRERIEKGVVLKTVTELASQLVQVFPAHLVDRPAPEEDVSLGRREQPDHVLQEHALAGAAFADDGRRLSVMDFQVDPIEDRPGAETFGDVFKFDQRLAHFSPS